MQIDCGGKKMVEIRKPIQVSEAINRVLQHSRAMPTITVSLDESYNSILAEPIIAQHDVPPFNRSPYDGFAIRSIDSIGASGNNRKQFNVIDHIGAGQLTSRKLGEKEAVRIMTGAPIPESADAIVMLEQTVEHDGGFTIRKPFAKGENVSRQGEDAQQGEQLIEAGTIVHPGIVALLATFGYAKVDVAKKPFVGILSTGTELIDVDEPLQPGKIRNSNGPMIIAQLKRMGIASKSYGMRMDDLDVCCQIVEKALEECDVLITTGGVSVGDFDYLPAIYDRLKAKVLFNKVAMRPGSVTTVATVRGKLLFGLSGNPSACFSGFELFVRPALLTMMGCKKPFLPYAKAILTEDFPKPNPFMRFVRSIYRFEDGKAYITPAGFNKSNAVTSIARGNAFMVLPGGTRGYKKGTEVDVLLLGVEEGVDKWQLQ